MSIATELTALAANKAAIKAAIEAKNPATAPTDSLAQWPEAIASIPSGGGLTGYTLTLVGDNHLTNSDKSAIAVSLADGTIEMYDTYNALYEAPPIVVQNAVAYRRFSLNTNFDSGCTPISEDTMLYMRCACLMRGTLVSLADGSEKPIEDIGWGDELLVWDFGRGELAVARPLWIMRPQPVGRAYRIRFEEGVTLNVTGPHGHRAYNVDLQRFEYLPRSVGDRVWTLQGYKRVTGCELREVSGDCYNIITAGHLNMFANGVLTSCRLNNRRAFDAAMRFASPELARHPRSAFAGVPDGWIDGLCLCGQHGTAEETMEYVARLTATAAERPTEGR